MKAPRPSHYAFHVLALILALVLAGCRPAPPLRLGSNQWPGYEPVYLAREQGLLPPGEVKLIELPSSTEVIEYLRNGSLDAGMLTLDEVITLVSEGVPLQVVLVLDVSDGADALLAHPGIDTMEKLRGKRIGVELSAVGAVMLESALETAGLSLDDVDRINLPADQHLEAFRRHRVDALITFEPTRSRLMAEGAVELFNSHRIPGRIVDVLAVRKDALPSHRDHLSTLVRAYFAARRLMRAQPMNAYARMAPRLQTDAESLKRMYEKIHLPDLEENRAWLGDPPRLEKQGRQLASLMQKWQLIESIPPVEELPNGKFLPP